MAKTKEYNGTAFLCVVGPATEYGPARDSQEAIQRRAGDGPIQFGRATKGYENRQTFIDKFIASHHDFIFLMDHDMIYPPDVLERLRQHKLPFVSGFYMRRQRTPIAPVWFEDNPRGLWPHKPYIDKPTDEGLVKLGASGWGCILLHREVIMAVRELLKGENDVIEDDMDVWPYDLQSMMDIIKGLNELTESAPPRRVLLPALQSLTDRLTAEFRPLRGTNDVVGSDIRYPYFARKAGYQLWGDPLAHCGHIIDYPLTLDDWLAMPAEYVDDMEGRVKAHVSKERRKWAARHSELSS